jgi:hypothetical protein
MLTGGVTAQKFEQRVQHIIRVRRSSLVHLLLSTQGPDTGCVSGIFTAKLDARVAFRSRTTTFQCPCFPSGTTYSCRDARLSRVRGTWTSFGGLIGHPRVFGPNVGGRSICLQGNGLLLIGLEFGRSGTLIPLPGRPPPRTPSRCGRYDHCAIQSMTYVRVRSPSNLRSQT